MRILLTAILGALVMFIWTFIAHTFLPLGEAGVRTIPHEQVVIDALESAIGDQSAIYIFPSGGAGPDATREQKQEAMKRVPALYATQPSGMLVYHPAGRPFAFGRWLGVEFVTEFIEALLVIWLLTQTRIGTFGGRLGFVFVAGVLTAISTNISYWNWYGFPGDYTASYMFIQIVGFFLIGLAAGFLIKSRRPV
jgi:hypothetical protein